MRTYTIIKTGGKKELKIRSFSTLQEAAACVERLNAQLYMTPGYHYVIQISTD